MTSDQILKASCLTEKSTIRSSNLPQYTFDVALDATKHQIARAVEDTFRVTVVKVNTFNCIAKMKRNRKGRPGYTSRRKRAVVFLKQGEKIEIL